MLSMLMKLALHWSRHVCGANLYLAIASQFCRESGQRERTTSVHGKVDHAQT